MSNLRRGAAAALAAVAVLASVSACGVGGETQADSDYAPVSNVEYNPANGISLDSTLVLMRNVYVLAAEGVLPPRLRMTMVNTTSTDDALVGATVGVPAVGGRLIGGVAGSVPVPANTTVLVGSNGGPEVTFRGATAAAGTWVPVTLLFRNGRAVAGSVLVQSGTSEYSDGTLPTGRPLLRPADPVIDNAPGGEGSEPAISESSAPVAAQ